MKINHIKGFTILEALVTVLISTAVLAAVYSTFLIGNKTWAYYADNIAIKQEVRRALYTLTNELREAKNIFIVKKPGEVELSFYRPLHGSISYEWNKSGEDANKIIRSSPLEKRTLASQINSIILYQLANNQVYIEIAAGKDDEVRLKETIALRDKTIMFRKKRK